MNSVSKPEIDFMIEGIKSNIRTDGRERLQYREIQCEKDVIDQANGSVRLKLGSTEVVVGVKCELGEPLPTTPNSGHFKVLVRQCGALINRDSEIERMLLVSLENAGKKMLEDLCVLKGRLCWIVYVDAVVVEDDGDAMDCISLAVRAALLNTLVPIVSVVSGDAENIKVELNRDDIQFKRFNPNVIPLTVTLTTFSDNFVVDTSKYEELCNGCKLTTSITPDGKVCGLQKGGNGNFVVSEMYDMIIQAQNIGMKLFKDLNEVIEDK
ncbi:Ribosomal RNA-processing protein 42 [Entamoeba marina]